MKENTQLIVTVLAIGSLSIIIMAIIAIYVTKINDAVCQSGPEEVKAVTTERPIDTAMAASLAKATSQIQQDSVEMATLRDSLEAAQDKLNVIYKEYDKTMQVKKNKTFVDLIYQYEKLATVINKQRQQ